MTAVAAPAKKELIVAVIGYTGGVGKCLLAAMDRVGLPPFALVRSSTMTFPGGVDDGDVDVPVDYATLGERLLAVPNGIPVIADVTASAEVQTRYAGWLASGISVVAANKGIFAGPEAGYEALLEAVRNSEGGRRRQSKLLHEATVGAGLPVLGTLQSLRASSHEIVTVEGVLSGTLAYVLGAVAGKDGRPLSEAVREARRLGYTEPDPRDDLNGMDVARKAVILARVAGMKGVELSDMDVESLVPEPLRECPVDEFMDRLSEFDGAMRDRVAAAEASGGRLHYAARVDVVAGRVAVGLLPCDASHPFHGAGSDNLVAITTNFYTPRPLVVQGAGAGGDVTATGVLADILKCAE